MYTRDEYNAAILGEAADFQVENGNDADIELDAQIDWIRQAMAAQASGGGVAAHLDRLIDHLRTMLEISYLDADDLPDAPPARLAGSAAIARTVEDLGLPY